MHIDEMKKQLMDFITTQTSKYCQYMFVYGYCYVDNDSLVVYSPSEGEALIKQYKELVKHTSLN